MQQMPMGPMDHMDPQVQAQMLAIMRALQGGGGQMYPGAAPQMPAPQQQMGSAFSPGALQPMGASNQQQDQMMSILQALGPRR
jgi:hypothetical protein